MNGFDLRLQAARQLPADQLLTLKVPSVDFLRDAQDVNRRIEGARKKVSEWEQKLVQISGNKAAVEVSGKDFATEIKNARTLLTRAQNELHVFVDERRSLFSAELEILKLKKSVAYKITYEHYISPFGQAIEVLFSDLRKQLQSMNATVSFISNRESDASLSSTVVTVDREIDEFSRMTKEAGLSGGVNGSVSDSIRDAIRQCLRRIPRNELNQLLKAVGAEPFLTAGEQSAFAAINQQSAVRLQERELSKKPSGLVDGAALTKV